ncbi:MAG: hypothetical protein NDJ89_15975 [Oligoflexia bacterium]|nr:hypothetical protein [Oligoflexia bacterium]
MRTIYLAVPVALAVVYLTAVAQAADCSQQGASQTQSYCDAAKASKETADAQKSVAYAYTAAAAVCTYACAAASYDWATAGSAQQYCNYTSWGAAGFEAIKTQEFAGAMMSLGSYMLTKDSPVAANGAKMVQIPVVEKQVAMSCITAGTSALSATMKYSAASDANKAANANLKLAERTSETRTGVALSGASAGSLSSGAGSGSLGTIGSQSASSAGKTAETSATQQACAQGASTGELKATVMCALASDSRLPSSLLDPGFEDALKKATGMSASDFFKSVDQNGPTGALSGALGAGMNAEGKAKLSSLMAGLERRAHADLANSGYTGGGGGGSAAGSGGNDMDKLMANLMGSLLPQEKAEDKGPARSLAFNAKNFPPNVTEDRRVSIFERVTARYYHVSPRLFTSPSAAVAAPAGNPLSNQGLPSSLYR